MASGTKPTAMDLSTPQMQIKPIVQRFLSEYSPVDIDPTNLELEAWMKSEMDTRHFRCPQLEKTVHLAASLIELAYHDFSMTEKKNMALYNWFMIYIDDLATTDPAGLDEFEQRFFRGKPQLNPVIDALVEVLKNMWDLYDPLSARTMMTSTLNFFTSNRIETMLKTTPLVKNIQRFPGFLRVISGVGESFALHIFTKSGNFTMMDVVQALPDMAFWICASNDLLSFYKEELEGDKANYIHLRAKAENLGPLEMLANIAEELWVSSESIHAVLAPNPDALNAWKVFERGSNAWHLSQDRYKLKDLRL